MDQKREVICTFTTKLEEELRVPEDEIALSTDFGPSELNSILK
jgi:hypothetical protein